jgi:carboxyl-terminal processing protease
MIKKNNNIIVLGLIVSVMFAFLITSKVEAKDEQKEESSKLKSYIKFTRILAIIEDKYVDDLNTSTIVDKALNGLLKNLDAHSTFMDSKSFKQLTVQTKGEFGGLGISVGMKDGALTVIAPLDDTPAFYAGVKSGDIIIKIDDKPTLEMDLDEAVSIMRGKPKTPIEITVFREGEQKPLKIKIIRDIIKIQSVYAKRLENEDDILYIRVTNFDQKVAQGISDALKKYPKTKGILLDLRNNPGGLLDQAIDVVDIFVDKGVIVSQKGRDKDDYEVYNAKKSNTLTDKPMVVLVNGGSASASEIVAGALQDHKRAVILGAKTFGKGSVQVVIPISEDEAIKITVARYFLPSDRTIQAVGITPDIIVRSGELVKQEENEFALKEKDLKLHLQGELEKIDTNETNITVQSEDNNSTDLNKTVITQEQLYNDAQLKSANDVLKALITLKR